MGQRGRGCVNNWQCLITHTVCVACLLQATSSQVCKLMIFKALRAKMTLKHLFFHKTVNQNGLCFFFAPTKILIQKTRLWQCIFLNVMWSVITPCCYSHCHNKNLVGFYSLFLQHFMKSELVDHICCYYI